MIDGMDHLVLAFMEAGACSSFMTSDLESTPQDTFK